MSSSIHCHVSMIFHLVSLIFHEDLMGVSWWLIHELTRHTTPIGWYGVYTLNQNLRIFFKKSPKLLVKSQSGNGLSSLNTNEHMLDVGDLFTQFYTWLGRLWNCWTNMTRWDDKTIILITYYE
jgi:hypothetical protein